MRNLTAIAEGVNAFANIAQFGKLCALSPKALILWGSFFLGTPHTQRTMRKVLLAVAVLTLGACNEAPAPVQPEAGAARHSAGKDSTKVAGPDSASTSDCPTLGSAGC